MSTIAIHVDTQQLQRAGRRQLRVEEAEWQQAPGIVARFFKIQEDAS